MTTNSRMEQVCREVIEHFSCYFVEHGLPPLEIKPVRVVHFTTIEQKGDFFLRAMHYQHRDCYLIPGDYDSISIGVQDIIALHVSVNIRFDDEGVTVTHYDGSKHKYYKTKYEYGDILPGRLALHLEPIFEMWDKLCV